MDKAEIRKKYAELLEKLNTVDRDEVLQFNNRKVIQYFEESRHLLQQVTETQELALDVKLLADLVRLLKEKAESLDTNADTFDENEFADCLRLEMTGGTDDSQQEGGLTLDQIVDYYPKIGHLLNRPHGLKCMIGAVDLDAVPPPRKERTKREKQAVAAEKRPEKTLARADEEPTTEELVMHVYNCLKKVERPVNYFKFLLHPTSFGQSVENIFHFSFLIRDMNASVSLDKDRIPVIDIVSREEKEAVLNGTVHSEAKQFVMSMDMDDWEELVLEFLPGCPAPMIPPYVKSDDSERRKSKKK